MIRRCSMLIISCIMLLLCGCDLTLFPTDQNNEPLFDPNKYLSEFQNEWHYNTLSTQEKTYYGHLYTAVKDAERQEATVSITDEQNVTQSHPGVRVMLPDAALTKDRISALFESFFRDNPQFFYLSRTYHLEGHRSSDNSVVYYDGLILEFSMPLSQRQRAIEEVEQAIQPIMAECPNTQDEFLRELYLHDRLAELCSYDEEAAKEDSDADSQAYTAYGALIEGEAVCEGYAKAMQLLLRRNGIQATVVSGTSLDTNEAHMWNLVKINDNTYYLDPTWNDSNTYPQHTYFNFTTAMLEASYRMDSEQPVVVPCNEPKDNFFVRNNAYIDTYEREVIAQAIAQQIRDGNSIVQLQFASGKFSNGQLFLKNHTLTEQMVNPYLVEENLTLWEYQLWLDESQRVLTLTKKTS